MSDAGERSSKHPTFDNVHLELVEATSSAAADVPDVVRRLSLAADEVKREGRLIRMESQKVRHASNPGFPRPKIRLTKR